MLGHVAISMVAVFIKLSVATDQSQPLPRSEELIDVYLKLNKVVPDVIPKAPKAPLEVTYKKNVIVDFGLELKDDQVEKMPVKTSWPTTKGSYYTLIFFTPDSPSRHNQSDGQFVLWFVANINDSCIAKSGNTYTEYLGPKAWTRIPDLLGELRRYIFIVFKQPVKPLLYRMGITYEEYYDSRQRFNVTEFAKEYKLGEPIAVNIFQMSTVEQKRNWTVMPEWHKDPMKHITLIPPPEHTLPHDY